MNFLTLDEYLAQARKIMIAERCVALVDDEDAVADVAYKMIQADQTWNEAKSSRRTWRYDRAKYAIKRILYKRKQTTAKLI